MVFKSLSNFILGAHKYATMYFKLLSSFIPLLTAYF